MTHTEGPADAATIKRAWWMMNEDMFTVALQLRRVRSSEPEDTEFPMRRWADLQFLIVALRRLRRAAELAASVPRARSALAAAIQQFDKDLPMLAKMRNVGEHIDEYGRDSDRRRHKDVEHLHLHVGSFNGTTYEWLGEKLNIDDAHDAAIRLLTAARSVVKARPKNDT